MRRQDQSKFDRRRRNCGAIFGFLISAAIVIGKAVYETNGIEVLFESPKVLAVNLAVMAGIWLLTGAVFILLSRFLERRPRNRKIAGEALRKFLTSSRGFLIVWAGIAASRIPAFLAYDPGIMAYDTYPQSRQAIEGLTAGFSAYNKYHPPLHTMIWALCIKLGSGLGVEAVVVYEVMQIALLSFAFTVMLRYMAQRNVPAGVILLAIFFIALNPVIAIMSLEMVKDSFLAAFFILLSVKIAKLTDNPSLFLKDWLSCAEFCVLTVIVCLLRNNAVYAVILFVPVACILLRKYIVRLLPLLLLSIGIFYLINAKVYPALGIQEGNSREMFSVPMMQIANVTVNEEETLTAEEKQEISKFWDFEKLKSRYNPRFADPVKNAVDSEYLSDHKKEFLTLWAGLLRRYPLDYIDAFLTLNIPYWYPGSDTVDRYSQREYIETGIYQDEYFKAERENKYPGLYAFYESFAKYEAPKKHPVATVLFAIWVPVWLVLFTFFMLLSMGRPESALIAVIPFFFWLTFMAGPVSNFRYIFPIYALYPLLIAKITE